MSSNQLLLQDTCNCSLRTQVVERVKGIDEEMKKVESSLGNFLTSLDHDFNGIITKTGMLKKHMSKVKEEHCDAETDLKTFKAQLKRKTIDKKETTLLYK